MDLAIAIRIGSPASTLHLVKTTIGSIRKNIGRCRYRFILSLDPKTRPEIKKYVYEQQQRDPKRFQVMGEATIHWADFINQAIKLAGDCEFFIKAHDDIKLLTPNFFPIIKKILSTIKEPIGWISFDEANYTYVDYYYGPPTRPGWHKDFYEEDAWNRRKLFQFHNLPDNWWKGIPVIDSLLHFAGFLGRPLDKNFLDLLDFPTGPVKCHAPWNMFVMIKMSSLKKIGPCENWQTYNALLVDEDWGLRALQKRLWNIWIPSVKYLHLRPRGLLYGNRSQNQVAGDAKRVHALFKKKWGFGPLPTSNELKSIKSRFHRTFIPWSIGRLSYDWDYIKAVNQPIRLHLGCGKVRLPGFINIDLADSPAVDRQLDIRQLDYPDSHADLIYTSHVLEHFPHGEIPSILSKWLRILKPKGKLVVVIPNFDNHLGFYLTHGRTLTDNLLADITGGALFPKISRNFVDYHKTIFNPDSFLRLGRQAGFSEIKQLDLTFPFPIPHLNPTKLHYSSMAFELTK